jgi:hypothetical protein
MKGQDTIEQKVVIGITEKKDKGMGVAEGSNRRDTRAMIKKRKVLLKELTNQVDKEVDIEVDTNLMEEEVEKEEERMMVGLQVSEERERAME